jgi:ABC-type glycerol-3-phosphate transport system permease component
MKRGITVFAVILALSLLLGVILVGVVNANPFAFYTPIDPVPGTIPPSITIYSPRNDSINYKVVAVSFNASKPQLDDSWTSIIEVSYTLDSNPQVEVYSNFVEGQGNPGIPAFSTAFNLTLPEGNHVLKVNATGVVLKDLVPKPQGLTDIGVFYVWGNSTTHFTVGNQPTTPNNITSYLSNSAFITVVAIVIAVVIVASISFVYFKRHKSRLLSYK